jgi:uncharacterized repeat protein (TIGR01451 family)
MNREVVVRSVVVGAIVIAMAGSSASPAAAQVPVTVSTAAQLEAAVTAALGSTSTVDIRIKAGTYTLSSPLELSVAEGATATLRNYGDGPVILTMTDGRVLRTGFVTRRGTYVIKGLTLAGSKEGIVHEGGDVRIEDSTSVDNDLGFYTDSSNANITIVNTTFWRNGFRCGGVCGAIWLDAHNSATITSSTIIGTESGPGIYGLDLTNGNGPEELSNSILLSNSSDCSFSGPGAMISHSIDSDGTCATPTSQATTYAVGSQDLMAGYGDHGGLVPTWDTSVLSPNPVVQAGNAAACPTYDARGGIRRGVFPIGVACDIGAFETTNAFRLDSAIDAGAVTLEVPLGGATVTDFHAIDPSRLPSAPPAGVTLPYGVFDWTATDLATGSAAVSITFPSPMTAPPQYWKVDAAGQWFDLCQRITCTTSTDQRTLHFTIVDGGDGDLDGVVNGSIRDPGGLGIGDDAPRPNVGVTKSFASSGGSDLTVDNGAVVTYRLTATNHGAGSTSGGITITDILDPDLALLPAGSDPRCTTTLSPQDVTCTATGPLAPGSAATFDLSVQVSPDAAPAGGFVQIGNTARVATLDDSDPSDDVSNTAMLTVNGPAPPNLAITKALVPPASGIINNGSTVQYRLSVTNLGSGPTTAAVVVTDTLDPRLSYSATGSDPRCSPQSQLITCVITGVVAAGASDHFDIAVLVAPNAAPNGGSTDIENVASVSTQGDSVSSDNTSVPVRLTVTGPVVPNLTIAKQFVVGGTTQLTVSDGGAVSYRLQVNNVGAGPTTGPLTVTDILDSRLSFVVTGSDPRCASQLQVITCVAPNILAAGASDNFDIAVLVAAGAPAGGSVQIGNTASVTSANDSNPNDNASNTALLTVQGPQAPNMTVTKQFFGGGTTSLLGASCTGGCAVFYRVIATNAGSAATTGPVTVTDTLDSRLSFTAGADPRCSAVGQVVTCVAPGPITPGVSVSFNIAVALTPNAVPPGIGPVEITNTATVSCPGDSTAADDTSNAAVLTLYGPPAPDLIMEKGFPGPGSVADSLTVAQGATLTYRLTVRNLAGPTYGPVTVTDLLDPRLSFVTVGSDSRCSAAGQLVTCVAPGLSQGASTFFDIAVRVSNDTLVGVAPIINSATASTPYETLTFNNTDTAALYVMVGAPTTVGTNVTVQPTNAAGTPQPVSVTFNEVTSPGFTTSLPSSVPLPGVPLPPNFRVGSVFYDIFTTAQYTAPATVCVTGSVIGLPALWHLENGTWVELPNQQRLPASGPPYTTVCATTNSFSPFVVGIMNMAPTLSLPANITAEASSAAGAIVVFAATATDSEDGQLAASCSPGSGTVFPFGVTTVTCTATDSDGESASGSFTVTVVDTTPPLIATPGTITQTASSVNGAAVSFTASASDMVSGSLTPVCAPASGSVFPVGTNTVTCSAQDAAGNGATATFTITVVAQEDQHRAPTLTGITPDSGRRGTLQIVFFQGTGLRKNLSVRFGGGDITVIEEASINATTAAALIYIKPNAAKGPRAVTVSNAYGTSNALAFVVK